MRIIEITQPVQEGVNDPHIFKAAFMAGSPGAGKSTIARMLFSNTGLKPLNVDKFWALYNKKERPGDYERYWELYQKQERNLLQGRLGLIIDGTAKNPDVISDIKQRLESRGYETIMVFVDVDLETSLKRASLRARDPSSPDAGREVDPEFIKKTHNRVQVAKDSLKSLFGNQFFNIDNSGSYPDFGDTERQIRRWLNTPVRNEIATSWIENEKRMIAQQRASRASNATKQDNNTRI
jgi:adenylate kinase family enzyme